MPVVPIKTAQASWIGSLTWSSQSPAGRSEVTYGEVGTGRAEVELRRWLEGKRMQRPGPVVTRQQKRVKRRPSARQAPMYVPCLPTSLGLRRRRGAPVRWCPLLSTVPDPNYSLPSADPNCSLPSADPNYNLPSEDPHFRLPSAPFLFSSCAGLLASPPDIAVAC